MSIAKKETHKSNNNNNNNNNNNFNLHHTNRVSGQLGRIFGSFWLKVFSMTLRKADGAELGLNVKALDGQKAGVRGRRLAKKPPVISYVSKGRGL